MSVAVAVLAAGSGTRVGAGTNKVLLPLGGESLVARSVRTALAVDEVTVVVVVGRAGDGPDLTRALSSVAADAPEVELRLTEGGATRHASEVAALAALADVDPDVIVMHDAARPLADVALYDSVISVARTHGGAVPTVPADGLIRRAGGPVPGVNAGGADDVHAAGVQTPQAFRADVLRAAYAWAERSGFEGTDTSACVAAWAAQTTPGHRVGIAAVPSGSSNLKVTYAGDLPAAAALLR